MLLGKRPGAGRHSVLSVKGRRLAWQLKAPNATHGKGPLQFYDLLASIGKAQSL